MDPAPALPKLCMGRKHGAASHASSLLEKLRLAQAGVDFESIWAWEATQQDPVEYWDLVPDIYKQRSCFPSTRTACHHHFTSERPALSLCACRLHFYNTPIKENFTHAAHPLNIIRNICQPGDFIAVKLDIDNGPMEMAIMDAISGDTDLRGCISEMFFEQHYSHPGEAARDFRPLVHHVYYASPHGMQTAGTSLMYKTSSRVIAIPTTRQLNCLYFTESRALQSEMQICQSTGQQGRQPPLAVSFSLSPR